MPFDAMLSVSFIIPAHNEEQLLGRTLCAINRVSETLRETVEVIVVDDASTDCTVAVAREHGARVVSVNYRQIAATRNAGARQATGDLLVFVDADTVVNEAVARAAIAAMYAGAAGGGCAFRFGGRLPLYARVLTAIATPLYRVAGLASGCFFCTREAFRSVGGFDETLFGAEEAAISRALCRQGRFVILREADDDIRAKVTHAFGRGSVGHHRARSTYGPSRHAAARPARDLVWRKARGPWIGRLSAVPFVVAHQAWPAVAAPRERAAGGLDA